MHEITSPITTQVPPPRRSSRLITRWIAATLVVAVVFLGARHTVVTHHATAHTAIETPATKVQPKLGEAPTSDDADTVDDASDIFDEVFPDATLPNGQDSTSADRDTSTATGGPDSSWSMQYPSSWTMNELVEGLAVFDAPDQPNVAMVTYHPLQGDSFEDQATQELDDLRSSLGDTELVDVVITTVDGRPAEQAGFYYTNPDGQPATVWVTWILDGDTVYLVAGEAPTADTSLAAQVEDTLNTFRLDGTA